MICKKLLFHTTCSREVLFDWYLHLMHLVTIFSHFVYLYLLRIQLSHQTNSDTWLSIFIYIYLYIHLNLWLYLSPDVVFFGYLCTLHVCPQHRRWKQRLENHRWHTVKQLRSRLNCGILTRHSDVFKRCQLVAFCLLLVVFCIFLEIFDI